MLDVQLNSSIKRNINKNRKVDIDLVQKKMFSQSNKVCQQKRQQRVILEPIKRSKKRKLLQSKQKNFVLDCTNQTKSKLEQYNYLKDKYLNYCVVKVPKRKRFAVNAFNKSQKGKQNVMVKDHNNFKHFLESKRQQILAKANMTTGFDKQKSLHSPQQSEDQHHQVFTQRHLNQQTCHQNSS